ncbi:MAG: hypothetical protein ACRDD8_15840 [Bacteroidales bacterium]
MKTILVQFKRGEKIYTYNTEADVKVGDIIDTGYLDSECKVVDIISDSKYNYISKDTGDLKTIMSNVKDIKIKELGEVRSETMTKFFMKLK